MNAISSFHTKAKAQSLANAASASDRREQAGHFLSELDELLSEGFNEVVAQ
jgi:hypothetical protein